MMSAHDPLQDPARGAPAFRQHRGSPSALEAKIDAYAAALSEWLRAWYHAEEARRARAFTWPPRQRQLVLAMGTIFGLIFVLLVVLHRFAL